MKVKADKALELENLKVERNSGKNIDFNSPFDNCHYEGVIKLY